MRHSIRCLSGVGIFLLRKSSRHRHRDRAAYTRGRIRKFRAPSSKIVEALDETKLEPHSLIYPPDAPRCELYTLSLPSRSFTVCAFNTFLVTSTGAGFLSFNCCT